MTYEQAKSYSTNRWVINMGDAADALTHPGNPRHKKVVEPFVGELNPGVEKAFLRLTTKMGGIGEVPPDITAMMIEARQGVHNYDRVDSAILVQQRLLEGRSNRINTNPHQTHPIP